MGGVFLTKRIKGPVTDNHPFVKHVKGIIRACTKGDFDEVVVVTGRERYGKSGVAHLAQCIAEPDWDVEKQVHWSSRAYTAAVPHLKAGQTNRHDEAVRGAASYNFMSEENKALAEFFTVGGFYNVLHILLYPTLRWVTPILKEHRCTYNWHVIKRYRDHAVVQVRQLRDDDQIFDKPRVLFTFDSPKPRGERWERERVRKKEMADMVASGRANDYDNFQAASMDMKRRLKILGGPETLEHEES